MMYPIYLISHPPCNPLQIVDVFDCGLNFCFGRRSAPPPRVSFLCVFNRDGDGDGVLLSQMARDGLHVSAQVRLMYFMLIASCRNFSLNLVFGFFCIVTAAFQIPIGCRVVPGQNETSLELSCCSFYFFNFIWDPPPSSQRFLFLPL
jgi:hypothetical protein